METNVLKFPEKKKDYKIGWLTKSVIFVGVFIFIFSILIASLIMGDEKDV